VEHAPAVLPGGFPEEKVECMLDFANKRLGGGYLTYGMVQEEKLVLERFEIAVALAMGKHRSRPGMESTFSMSPTQAWVIQGARRWASLGFYGWTPKDWQKKISLLTPAQDEYAPVILALDCIKADFVQYERRHLEALLLKAYVGFTAVTANDPRPAEAAPPVSRIATGNWGCGAFFNNPQVMYAVQALAAALAGARLNYYAFGVDLTVGRGLVDRWISEGTSVEQALDELAELCRSGEEWRTSFKPGADWLKGKM